MATTDDVLLHELDARGVLRLTLNDPRRRNPLSEAMLAALHTAILDAGENPAVRVVILGANGPAFSAGHDLREMTAEREAPDRGRAYFAKMMGICSTVMQAVVTCPKPVIAEVGGVAAAAGCQLVASCDMAIASEGALFNTPGVNIGLFCSTPMVAISRNVSSKHAMEMLLTGDLIPAARAEEMGLVNRVVAEADLRSATDQLAAQIATKSTYTLAVGKRAFYEQAEMTLGEAYTYASRVMVENMLAHDAEEGIGAFLEKRSPEWKDS
ncbi:MAG: enoyl-CoA hydratase [Alphaproteobacteria bacterium TMED89]|nr:enoyl-CoA hydratase [Rhodospirillaceae bacterium]RPH17939.1 MAG: enoyl-CoA hydratase [Alphaproteobacteria bacterium TMED89]